MTTPKTPYDVEIDDLTITLRTHGAVATRLSARDARERVLYARIGYLRALADAQPRLDALVAALQDCAAGLDEIAAYLRRTGDNPELALARANQARAALTLALAVPGTR